MDVSITGSYLFRGILAISMKFKMCIGFDSAIFLVGIHCPAIYRYAKIYVYKNYFSIIWTRGKL